MKDDELKIETIQINGIDFQLVEFNITDNHDIDCEIIDEKEPSNVLYNASGKPVYWEYKRTIIIHE